MFRLLVVLTVALTASGCVAARREAAKANTSAGVEACKARKFPNFVAKAKCINQAEEALRSATPNGDLLNLRQATRLVLAEKMDAGTLTEAQADYLFAEQTTELVRLERLRSF